MKVAIVGGGLASMYAILACKDRGIVPDVIFKDFTGTFGAVYLRWVPKRVEEFGSKSSISITSVGTRISYIRKQFPSGIEDVYNSSFPDADFEDFGYNPKILRDHIVLAEEFNRLQTNKLLDWNDINNISYEYDRVFYSFPGQETLQTLGKYIFKIPVLSRESGIIPINSICYDGYSYSLFVRISTLFGRESIELPLKSSLTDRTIYRLFPSYKVSYIQDIHPHILYLKDIEIPRKFGKLIPIGRLARMERSLLAEDTYSMVTEEIENA